MGSPAELVLYGSLASRTFTARWILEEIGLPYRFESLDLRRGEQKKPEYRRINPMGKVPALIDGGVVITETPAICLHLADRYGYGVLAPRIEDPSRGPYLRWSVFATAVLEPATYLPQASDPEEANHVGWGDRETALAALEHALGPGPFVLGDAFSAADVALGSVVTVALFNHRLPDRPAFIAYNRLLESRPAYQRAARATWPPDLFPKP
jgi:glutathione S-transferase